MSRLSILFLSVALFSSCKQSSLNIISENSSKICMHGYFPTGQSVKETLAGLGLDLRDAQFIDEPPGKMKKLRFNIEKTIPGYQKIEISLKYEKSLFSSQRKWKNSDVKEAIVTKIKFIN